jgi:hypothetical protein
MQAVTFDKLVDGVSDLLDSLKMLWTSHKEQQSLTKENTIEIIRLRQEVEELKRKVAFLSITDADRSRTSDSMFTTR